MPEMVAGGQPGMTTFQACAEADPTRGGSTLRMCLFGVVRADKTVKLGSQITVVGEEPVDGER